MIASCIGAHKSAVGPCKPCVEICLGPMTFIKSRKVFKRLFILIKDECFLIDIQDQSVERHCKIFSAHPHKSAEGNDHVFNVPLVDVEHYVHYLAQIIARRVVNLVSNDRGGGQDPYRSIGMITCMVFTRGII